MKLSPGRISKCYRINWPNQITSISPINYKSEKNNLCFVGNLSSRLNWLITVIGISAFTYLLDLPALIDLFIRILIPFLISHFANSIALLYRIVRALRGHCFTWTIGMIGIL